MAPQTMIIFLILNLLVISFALKFLNKLNKSKLDKNKLDKNKLDKSKLDKNKLNKNKLNKKFYDISIYPELENIKLYNDDIHEELKTVLKMNKLNDWIDLMDLMETELNDTKLNDIKLNDTANNMWKIMPFYYYGTWSPENCKKMPKLTEFLKSLPKLKIALLSVLSPHTRLNEHKGSGNHSNNVLRCNYGLIVPEECYIYVKEDNENMATPGEHQKNKWLIFDDSKTHYAINNSDYHRIVLIVDLERPKYIEKGKSDVSNTKELLDIVEYFKKSQDSNLLEQLNGNLLDQNDLDQQKQDKI